MAIINVQEVVSDSVTLEYTGIVVKFVLDAKNHPIPVSSGGKYHALQGWEKRDMIARAAAILKKNHAR